MVCSHRADTQRDDNRPSQELHAVAGRDDITLSTLIHFLKWLTWKKPLRSSSGSGPWRRSDSRSSFSRLSLNITLEFMKCGTSRPGVSWLMCSQPSVSDTDRWLTTVLWFGSSLEYTEYTQSIWILQWIIFITMTTCVGHKIVKLFTFLLCTVYHWFPTTGAQPISVPKYFFFADVFDSDRRNN